MEFSRQEYWSGLLFPSPGDLLKPGIEPVCPMSSALAGVSFITVPPAKHLNLCQHIKKWSITSSIYWQEN